MSDFNMYQMKARTFLKPTADKLYLTLALCEEAGEVLGKIAKQRRDGTDPHKLSEDVAKELGDVLFMVAGLAHEYGHSLKSIADLNINKLTSRLERGTIGGSGDSR